MTILIIQSDSEEKTILLLRLAKELGLQAQTRNFDELNANAMVRGIGRKATEEELISYLSKDNDANPINIDKAFSQYLDS